MNTKAVTLVCVAMGLLVISGGCATKGARADYDSNLRMARTQIGDGQNEKALGSLDIARKIANENEYDQSGIELLSAEVSLRSGDNDGASEQVQKLVDGDAKEPYEKELKGKALLKKGRYAEAETNFVAAQKQFEAQKKDNYALDVSRTSDLVSVARYFLAYQNGDLGKARGYMHEIENPELQHALNKAQKEVGASSL